MRPTLFLGSTCALSLFVTLTACGGADSAPEAAAPADAHTDSDAPSTISDGGPDGGHPSTPDAVGDTRVDALPDAPADTPVTPGAMRSQSGGSPAAITLAGGRAFVAIGPRLTIWDMSNPAAPALRGETEPFEGNLTGVAVVGKYAYVTQSQELDGRLRVVDVGNPALPKIGASIRLAASGSSTVPLGIVTDGTRLYVADQEHGISVLDVGDPAAPKVTQTLDVPGVTAVQIVGKRLYATFAGFTEDLSLQAFDLSAGLKLLGGVSFNGAAAVAVTSTNIAVATGIAGQQALDVGDLDDPKPWTLTGSKVDALSAAAGTNTIWLPSFDGLYAIDLSKPGVANIGPRIAIATEGARGVAVVGAVFGLVTNRGRFVSIDVSTEASPVAKATVDVSLCADCGGIRVDGDTLMIADHGDGLRTGRVSDLVGLGRGYLPKDIDFEDVALAAGKAYVADWSFGLRIYDVSNLAAPKALGTVDTPGYPSAAAYEDGRVYLGESTNGGALRVIDVSDPNKPTQLGAIATSYVWTLEVRNKIVYVADKTYGGTKGGLHIFDATNPAAIKQIGSYDGCGDVYDVAFEGNTAVVACETGWDLVDISSAATPKKLGHVDVKHPNAASAVTLAGSRAYLGHSGGVITIDITDPKTPKTIIEHPTAYEVRDLRVTKTGRLIAACGLGGVYQWDTR